jgi:hypothetical protein
MMNDIERLEDRIQKLSSEYHNEMYQTMDTKGNWRKSNDLLNNVINLSISLREIRMDKAKKQLDKAFTPRLKTMLDKSLTKE